MWPRTQYTGQVHLAETTMLRIAMLGTGFIGRFYTQALHGKRAQDRVQTVYGRDGRRTEAFAKEHGIPHSATSIEQAVMSEDVDAVVIGLPNHMHEAAVDAATAAGKAVLCTKPLGRNADEALRMLKTVEEAGVFHAYLEDLVYTPKTLKSLRSVQEGAVGDVLWVRSRETHPGPHSDWFWQKDISGGGAIIDMGCHCVEIIRNFIEKGIRPVEAMCWADTLVHPIEGEDHGIGLIRFENGAIGQFEVSWAFRGGMDLRDEVSGSEGTIWLNHWLRTGYEMFTASGQGGYVAEKAEGDRGWVFPVGDEAAELGYTEMFKDMFNSMDSKQTPIETFYDGYVVNAIIDTCYISAKSKQWEPVQLDVWQGDEQVQHIRTMEEIDGMILIKTEVMPDGKTKQILKDPESGTISEKIV